MQFQQLANLGRQSRLSARSARCLPICCVALFVAAGCRHAEAPEAESTPPAKVKWEGPLQGALEEWTELVGTTTPLVDRIARVTAPVEGRVLSTFADSSSAPVVEGQRVEKGTPLVRLDPTLIEAALAKAEAAQNVLREESRQAQIAVNLAASEVERLRQLKIEEDKSPPGTRTLVSPVERQKAELALQDAQSKLKAANGRIAAGTKDIDSLRIS